VSCACVGRGNGITSPLVDVTIAVPTQTVDGKVTAGPMNDTNTVIQSVDPAKPDGQDDPGQDDADD
jgi:hypothetical protein